MYGRSIVALILTIIGTVITAVMVKNKMAMGLPLIAVFMILPIYLAELDRKHYGKIGFPSFILAWLALLVLFCMGMYMMVLRGLV